MIDPTNSLVTCLPRVTSCNRLLIHSPSQGVDPALGPGAAWLTDGYGSKLNHQGTAGFGPWFRLPGFQKWVHIFDAQPDESTCLERHTAAAEGSRMHFPSNARGRDVADEAFFKSCQQIVHSSLAEATFLGRPAEALM